jgi:sterol desaturase/sphingolipid hydroxylase (fatty acid hydroxylase superfamily)
VNYVTFAIPFFILLMAVECLYGHLRAKQTYRLNDTINSLQMGTLSRLMSILKLGFSGVVFAWLVNLMGVTTVATDSIWVWVAAFVAYDFCYYWKHRFGHEWRIMWASHAAHHQSEEYNLSTALRQTGTDYIGFVFYLPLYLAGLPVEVVVTVGSLNLIYQFWVHTEHVRTLGPLEWIMITPSNHRVHHARNPDYIDRNYGGVFIIWDRLFGTFQAELPEQRCVYGITRGLKSWNPIWANLHVWYETFLISLRTKNISDKFRVWFKGPGWYPDDMQPTEQTDWQYPKFDPSIDRFAGWYSFFNYWVLTGAALGLLAIQDDLPRYYALLVFVWLCFSFYSQSCWLEARAYALKFETIRLVSLVFLLVLGVNAGLDHTITYIFSSYCVIATLLVAAYSLRLKAPMPAD